MQHIHVDSRRAAWRAADAIIPCDYLPTVTSAGYPVYMGTLGNHWISDLGTSLEVNLDSGDSVRVWIDEIWE